jgi:serine/threonine protein kinase
MLKILDFGIAKLLQGDPSQVSMTQTGMVMGTPLYMAPEQAAGRPDLIDHRTDIYALGAILYTLLSGRPPFVDEAPALILARHIKEPPPPLTRLAPSVPAALAAVIERCLAKSPDDRYPSATAMAEALSTALLGGSASLGDMETMAAPSMQLPLSAATGPQRSHPTPAPSVAPRAASADREDVNTTFSGSAGQVTNVTPQKRRWALPLAIAAVLAIAAGGVLWERWRAIRQSWPLVAVSEGFRTRRPLLRRPKQNPKQRQPRQKPLKRT